MGFPSSPAVTGIIPFSPFRICSVLACSEGTLLVHRVRSSHLHCVLTPSIFSLSKASNSSFLDSALGTPVHMWRHFCPHAFQHSRFHFWPLTLNYPHMQLPKELHSVCLNGFQALRGAHPSAGDLAAFLGLSVPKNKQLQRHHPLPGIGEEHTWLQPIAEKQPSIRMLPSSQQS